MFYSATHNKLINEHSTTHIPRDARLFYNEEDWLKYKEMVHNPHLSSYGFKEMLHRRNPKWIIKPEKRQFPELKISNTKLYSGK